MKTLILTVAVLCITAVQTLAQEQEQQKPENPKKVERIFRVEGKCGMCKDRIEEALDIRGVRFAQWNTESKMLKVIFNSQKITLEKIKQTLADAGHDTGEIKASEEAYNKLHHCCKYRK